jgi:hypothetical protein
MIKTHRTIFMPIYEGESGMSERIGMMLLPECTEHDKHIALFMADDILEFGKETAEKWVPEYIPALLQYCEADSEKVAQAAVYGLGGAASGCSSAVLAPYFEAMIEALQAVIMAAEEAEEPSEVSDNAVSALGHIIRRHHEALSEGGLPVSEVVDLWMAAQPCTTDDIEGRVVADTLAECVLTAYEVVAGEGHERLPGILSLLLMYLTVPGLGTAKLAKKIAGTLRALADGLPEGVLSAALEEAGEEVKDLAQQLLADEGLRE